METNFEKEKEERKKKFNYRFSLQKVISCLISYLGHADCNILYQKNPTTIVTFLSFYLEIQNCKQHVFNLLHFDQKIEKYKILCHIFLTWKSEVLSPCLSRQIAHRYSEVKVSLDQQSSTIFFFASKTVDCSFFHQSKQLSLCFSNFQMMDHK